MALKDLHDYPILKTQKIKDKIYKDYCDHIASGYPEASWSYNKDGIEITYQGLEYYIKHDPSINKIHKKIATAKALKKYIDLGLRLMEGKIKGSQASIYQVFMRNLFGWDKDSEKEGAAKGAFNRWYEEQINKLNAE